MRFPLNAVEIVSLSRFYYVTKSIHTISSVRIPVINSFFVLTGGDSKSSLESCVLSPFVKAKRAKVTTV